MISIPVSPMSGRNTPKKCSKNILKLIILRIALLIMPLRPVLWCSIFLRTISIIGSPFVSINKIGVCIAYFLKHLLRPYTYMMIAYLRCCSCQDGTSRLVFYMLFWCRVRLHCEVFLVCRNSLSCAWTKISIISSIAISSCLLVLCSHFRMLMMMFAFFVIFLCYILLWWVYLCIFC